MLLAAPSAARADFTGIFTLPWSESGIGSDFTGAAPTSLTLTATADNNYDYFILVTANRDLSFDWSFSTGAAAGDSASYLLNGTPTLLATDTNTNGSVALLLSNGDTVGFRVTGNGTNPSSLFISNFVAVPEPSTMGLMALAAAGLFAAKRRRKVS
jgi:hypothetical protein